MRNDAFGVDTDTWESITHTSNVRRVIVPNEAESAMPGISPDQWNMHGHLSTVSNS